MNPVATILLAFSMSTDAFAAAIGKGAALHRPSLRESLRTGLIFGGVEAITPLIGWLLGKAAVPYVSTWGHWIAFTLLSTLGVRMISGGFSRKLEKERLVAHSFWSLALTGFSTSIDGLAVGIGLAFVEANIYLIVAIVGVATTMMATIGALLGRILGTMTGQRAEIVGGFVLIGVGTNILLEHLKFIG